MIGADELGRLALAPSAEVLQSYDKGLVLKHEPEKFAKKDSHLEGVASNPLIP